MARRGRPAKHDTVNHPKHYNSLPAFCECGRRVECIDVAEHLGFSIGNAVKYLWRADHKNGLEDLKKAAWYVQRELERRQRPPRGPSGA